MSNGSQTHKVIAGDINGDCRVDLGDIVIQLNHWLEDRRPVFL